MARKDVNPIQDGHFRGCSRMGGSKSPHTSLSHISCNDETWHSYTLPKEDPKIYESRDTPPDFCWHQHFFTGNQQILLYQEIQIYIAFWYIIYNSFNFSWVFQDFLNKPGYDFDDVSKNSYPRPSLNTGILK